MAARHRYSAGFTLLELVVATAILAIGLVALTQVFSRGLRSTGSSERVITATLIARLKLAELEEMAELTNGAESGDVAEPYKGYTWDTEIEDVPESENLKRVRVRIGWTEAGAPRDVALETILFKPPAEEETEEEEGEEAEDESGASGSAGMGDFPAAGMGDGMGIGAGAGGGGMPSGMGDFFGSAGGRSNTPVARRGVGR